MSLIVAFFLQARREDRFDGAVQVKYAALIKKKRLLRYWMAVVTKCHNLLGWMKNEPAYRAIGLFALFFEAA
jgi:hypothetical protein